MRGACAPSPWWSLVADMAGAASQALAKGRIGRKTPPPCKPGLWSIPTCLYPFVNTWGSVFSNRMELNQLLNPGKQTKYTRVESHSNRVESPYVEPLPTYLDLCWQWLCIVVICPWISTISTVSTCTLEQIAQPMATHDTHKSLKHRFRYLKHARTSKIIHSNRN